MRGGTWGARARLIGGAAIIGVLVWRLGAEPFVAGLRSTSTEALAAAIAITGVTTLCCARRWSLLSARLGVTVPLPAAVTAYYRSQFLNATLPGGILGDVHRAVRHGRDVGDLGGSARSVAAERGAGQIVQLAISLAVLLALPSPFRSRVLVTAALAVAGVGVVAVLVLVVRRVAASRGAVSSGAVNSGAVNSGAVSSGLRGTLVRVAGLSVLAAAGHALIFLVAARTAGVTVGFGTLLPVALIVLLASAIPMNVAGWGPREGVAAWAFAAIGLPAGQGLTVSVVYGVMALVATLPGAVLIVLGRRGLAAGRSSVPRASLARVPDRPVIEVPAALSWEGAAGG